VQELCQWQNSCAILVQVFVQEFVSAQFFTILVQDFFLCMQALCKNFASDKILAQFLFNIFLEQELCKAYVL